MADNNNSNNDYNNIDNNVPLDTRPNVIETRNMTIDRVLKDYELCDVAGRLSIIEHAISQLRCRRCPACTEFFYDDDYKVIPCLCRMHSYCYTKWRQGPRPRKCPKCDIEIVDEEDLWDMRKLRQRMSYLYGSDSDENLDSDDDNDNTDEESPREFVPRMQVPPQSPRRKIKARIGSMRKSLSTEALDIKNQKSEDTEMSETAKDTEEPKNP